MNKRIYLKLLVAMISIGIAYGTIYHYIVMPMFSNRFLHCIAMSLAFGVINYFVAINIYKKYYTIDQKNKLLLQKIRTDKLTGVLNRKALDEDVENIAVDNEYSLIFIDIDNFSDFNNKFGHLVGDSVLKKVCETIKLNIRHRDKVYRYGGEEFIIILKDCNKNNAIAIAEKVRINVSEMNNSPYESITLSIGVSSCPEDGQSAYNLIEWCDNAMLKAKKQGKNRTCIYSNT